MSLASRRLPVSSKQHLFVNSVATSTPQLDRTDVNERVLRAVRGLLEELGSQGALPLLMRIHNLIGI